MSTDKHIDRICIIITLVALLVTVLFMNGEKLGIERIVDEDAEKYAQRLCDLNRERQLVEGQMFAEALQNADGTLRFVPAEA